MVYFFRLLKKDDKEAALRRCIADLWEGVPQRVDPHTMRQETFAPLPLLPY